MLAKREDVLGEGDVPVLPRKKSRRRDLDLVESLFYEGWGGLSRAFEAELDLVKS